MIIDENLLLDYGAVYEEYSARKIIYENGDTPQYYFQIISGIVELNNYHEDGKEFTLNILSEGQSIGESLLFGNKKYPMNAVARTETQLLKLAKPRFLQLLAKNQDIMFKLFEHLSDRLFYKYVMLFNNSAIDPQAKIKALMDYYKEYHCRKEMEVYCIPLTRQQIANLTGLRVETVIRTVKKMEKEKVVSIKDRQIYY